MRRGKGKLVDKRFIVNVLLISGMVLAFFLFCGFVGIYRILDEDRFASGVLINTTNVSGMSPDEAQEAISADLQQQLKLKHITLDYMGDRQELDADSLGLSYDVTSVLDEAYQYNKNNADTVEQRFNKTAYLSHGVDFQPELLIDQTQLRKSLEQYVEKYEQSPVNASASFNPGTETFSYTSAKSGIHVNIDQLMADVVSSVNSGENAVVNVTGKTVAPEITIDDLKQNTALISTFQTVAADSSNRNINISLISAAVNGIEIKPGETLSINQLVGQRTEAKGYMPASAISDGILVDEVGGGICQLAGTLYNAALLADLKIVERVRHTWPSDYLPVGQDSTLTWDNKDLKINNPTKYSVFISAKFQNHKVIVKIYGQPLEDGVTIKVQNNVIKELKPGKTEVRYTNELPVGKTQTVRKARTGYLVEVFRIYYRAGVEIDRERVSKDTYPALNKIVLKGRATSQDK
jgi:vancomycin resistance protein YoaR